MGWGSFVGGAIGIGADLYSAHQQRSAQEQANRTNIGLAHDQMNFQGAMSDTAHQREVRDLIAAGLNPALSANSGASTPVGSSMSVDPLPPHVPSGLPSSAIEMMRLKQDMKESESRIDKNRADANYTRVDTDSERPYAEIGRRLEKHISSLFSSSKSLYDQVAERVHTPRGYVSREQFRQAQKRAMVRFKDKKDRRLRLLAPRPGRD